MSNDFVKKNYHIIIYTFCYLSLLIGFLFGENVTSGPKFDFFHAWDGAMEFNNNIISSLINFEEIQNKTRVSPIYLILISFLNNIFKSLELTRFILFFTITFSQFFFYKILKLVFYPNIVKNKKNLFLLSCVIFISPSFRANVIWPESAMLGLMFFLIGLYFFFKSQRTTEKKYIYLNIFFIAIAAYIRPSFAVFSVFFFIYNSIKFKNLKIIISIILLNIFLAVPALYYVFILDVHFFNQGVKLQSLNLNYLNKILVIFSIIFFHTIPILFYKNFFYEKSFFSKNLSLLILLLPISAILIYLFSYDINLTGGGIFLHISYFIFNSYYFFFLLVPFFIFFIIKLLQIDFYRNFLILALVVISIPQFTVYHKYLDPLILILLFTLFNLRIERSFFNFRNLCFLYLFYTIYYFITFFNNYFLKT